MKSMVYNKQAYLAKININEVLALTYGDAHLCDILIEIVNLFCYKTHFERSNLSRYTLHFFKHTYNGTPTIHNLYLKLFIHP